MSQTGRDYSEKRDFIRMRVDADVVLIHEGDEIAGVCIDLSSSGMQVEAPRQFAVGDRLRAHRFRSCGAERAGGGDRSGLGQGTGWRQPEARPDHFEDEISAHKKGGLMGRLLVIGRD